jgi:hypothetical protein
VGIFFRKRDKSGNRNAQLKQAGGAFGYRNQKAESTFSFFEGERERHGLKGRKCLVLSCLVLSCLVLSCLVLSRLVIALVLSCLVLSCLVLSCLALSCLLSCLILSCLVFSCLVLCCVALRSVVLCCFVLCCVALWWRELCCVVMCLCLAVSGLIFGSGWGSTSSNNVALCIFVRRQVRKGTDNRKKKKVNNRMIKERT